MPFFGKSLRAPPLTHLMSSLKPPSPTTLQLLNHSVTHHGCRVCRVNVHTAHNTITGDRSRRCTCDRNLKLGAPYKLGAPLARSRPCLCSPAGGRTPEASSLGAAQLTVREPHLGHRVGHLTNGLDEVQGGGEGAVASCALVMLIC